MHLMKVSDFHFDQTVSSSVSERFGSPFELRDGKRGLLAC
jgi:hypothetical protein